MNEEESVAKVSKGTVGENKRGSDSKTESKENINLTQEEEPQRADWFRDARVGSKAAHGQKDPCE